MNEKGHFENIIGGTPAEKETAREDLWELFETRNSDLAQHELEKTEEDKEIISNVESIVDTMVKTWGGNPKPLPSENIYILKSNAVGTKTKGKIFGGIANPLDIQIGVEKGESGLGFASGLAHELFHIKSYKSAQVKNSMTDLYRSGFNMVSRKERRTYFDELEEAIVAESARIAFEKIKEDSIFQSEAKANEKIKNWVMEAYRMRGISEEKVREAEREWKYIPKAEERVKDIERSYDNEKDRAYYANGIFDRLVENKEMEFWERYSQREKLYKLCDEILEKSGDKFKDRDEVFDHFATANFTGNYLSIAHTVENTLGKGSFRRLAEEFATTHQGESSEVS